MIDELKEFFPNFGHLQESFLNSGDIIQAWQVTALDNNGQPYGSGFSKDLNVARKVAIAEFIERNFVLKHKSTEKDARPWMLDKYPTACGFAAGFEPLNTKIRSIGEGIERWALSKWIDDGCYLEKINSPVWPPECTHLIRDFDDIFVFKKEFLYAVKNKIIPFHLCTTIAFQSRGSFMGSAVRSSFTDALTHSIVESHRHLLISKQNRNFNIFPFNRIIYFAGNQDMALNILNLNRTGAWPTLTLEFQRDFQNDLFCISRTILKDWTPWERGPLNRMLY